MRLIKNLGVVMASVLVSLLLAEGVFRLFPTLIPVAVVASAPDMTSKTQILQAHGIEVGKAGRLPIASTRGGPDILLPATTVPKPRDPEDAAYGGVPTKFRIDGFCNDKPLKEIPAKLVAVGDSFTTCTAVVPGDSWSAQAAGALDVVGLNLGIGNTGLHQYYEAVKAKAPETARLLVVAIYEGNDLRDAVHFNRIRSAKGEAASFTTDHRRLRRAIADSVLGEAYLTSFIWGSAKLLQKRGLRPEFSYDVVVNGATVPLNVNDTDEDEVSFARRVQRGDIDVDGIVRLWDEPVGWIVDLARARGMDVVWTYIPSAYTAYAASVTFHDPGLAPVMANFSRRQRMALDMICTTRGLHCLDVVSAFERQSADQLTHFPSNVHLTRFGHQVVAEALVDFIRSRPALLRALTTD